MFVINGTNKRATTTVFVFVFTFLFDIYLLQVKKQIPRQVGPEREHFGGEDGLHTEIARDKPRYFWKYKHCRVSRKFKDRNIKDPKILINFMIQSNDFALQL